MADCYIVRRGGTVESSLGFPEFTYTGNYTLLDDGLAADGKTQNWRIKFLTSGVLTFTKLGSGENGIDVFCVGGGGGGSERANGGGGGYTVTGLRQQATVETAYSVVIGSGGAMGKDGGSTTCVGVTANGGKGATDNAPGAGGSGGGSPNGQKGGSDGSDGTSGWYTGGKGQRTTTREFVESGATIYAGGGGGGTGHGPTTVNGKGGEGGGGDGGLYYENDWGYVNAKSGDINTGGGGGGGFNTDNDAHPPYGAAGGSGIAVIRNAR